MVGGVMTTGQAMNNGRQFRWHRMRYVDQRQRDQRQGIIQQYHGAAEHCWRAAMTIGSLGAASPPIDG